LLALANGGGLLVGLAGTYFSQYTGFLTATLEATQCYVEGLVLFYAYRRHMPNHLLKTIEIAPHRVRNPQF
jgi:hypothetical protein